jgi:two-component system CheB/CheR fusion protein
VAAAGEPSLVVGLGASAGGIDALREFFQALDEEADLALVVIEHLDPTSKSLLPSVLNQFTTLPVEEISEASAIGKNRVFVVPPGRAVELHEGRFRLRSITDPNDRRTPIDIFFRSIAEAARSRAVGIVLSGAGSDGTLGCLAIANAGGMTMAQEPGSAKYDSMPRSAITTGVIDHVLRPKRMAEELLAYVGHVAHFGEEDGSVPEASTIKEALGEICDLLQKATNHNFKHYKTTSLVRRIARRMQVLRMSSVDAYVDRLRGDQDEVAHLFRELLIGVTSFFRDPEAFEVLGREVIAPLVGRRKGEPLRFWVPGCATGEEAYSLAIIAREALDGVAEPPELQIFATDIDERALSVARQGLYPAGIAENLSKERLERFFVKKGKRYQVTKEIRELCLFSPHNLINDPPFSRLDLISCRNLLIYFGSHLQAKLIPLFHYALRHNGYLFLGPSENISSHKELFVPINGKHRISQRKTTALRSSALLAGGAGFRGFGLRATESAEGGGTADLHQVMQRILLDEFAPKCVVVTEDGQILSASGDMERYLTVSGGTFQNNVIRLARSGLRVGLRAALSDAVKVRRKIVHDRVSVETDQGVQRVRVTVQPMPRLGEEAELFMVVFQDLGASMPKEEAQGPAVSAEADSLIEQLERELSSTREDLEKTIQDLEAANEELKSSNEELLSMNEELQSANEELETSKEEVQQSNEALARAHSNLSNLLTSTAIATIFLDNELKIQSFTPAVTDIYNLLASDVARPLAHITHRAVSMPPLPTARELLDQSALREDEVDTTDGRHYLRRTLPYRSQEGKAEGVVVTFIEVTELKKAEDAARRHQQWLQLITDALPAKISYVDQEHRFRFNNLTYERWFGVPRKDLTGQHVRDIFGEEAYARILPHMQRALSGEAAEFDAEMPYRFGGTRFIHSVYVPDRALDGSVVGYFALTYDVSGERRVNAALEQAKLAAELANRVKSDFLANMSHEIRTPMTAIMGYAELLGRHVTDPDNLACVDAIRRNGQHLLEIINDILDLSKIEAGMLKPHAADVSPWAVLREVVETLRPRAIERGLTLSLDSVGPLPAAISTDGTRFRQVLLNLLGNAIKFTHHGGVRVVAVLHASRELLEVRVADDGIGIAEEQLARLFEPFTQADASRTRTYGGTGLGLAISKRLVTLLGGTISVESEPNKGSTFAFTIATGPLGGVALTAELPAPVPEPQVPPRRLHGRRILVVDDRRDMRYLVQSYLEEAGAEVRTAGNGLLALEELERGARLEQAFDAIVLDMQMPAMDGYEAARRLREAGHQGLIVALTASAMRGDRERCLEAGCDEYLTKPVDRLALLEVLAHAGGSLPEEAAPAARSSAAPSRPARRLLVVEDNDDAAESLAILLEKEGFAVTIAKTGEAAVNVAETVEPETVLLDLGLPDMDGYETLRRLKQMKALSRTRYVALSGYGDAHDLARSREAGFDHHVTKPPAFDQLLSLVKSLHAS